MSDFEKEIKKTLETVASDLSMVKKLLGGDWQDQKKVGLIHTNQQLMEEVYDKRTGLLIRMAAVETAILERKNEEAISRRSAIAWGAGAGTMVIIGYRIVVDVVIPLLTK